MPYPWLTPKFPTLHTIQEKSSLSVDKKLRGSCFFLNTQISTKHPKACKDRKIWPIQKRKIKHPWRNTGICLARRMKRSSDVAEDDCKAPTCEKRQIYKSKSATQWLLPACVIANGRHSDMAAAGPTGSLSYLEELQQNHRQLSW